MKLNRNLHIKLTFFVLAFSLTTSYGQEYKYEIGVTGGATRYIGDYYPSKSFGDLGVSFGGLFRFNRDFRSSLKVEGNISTIDAFIQNNVLLDANAQYEYNFFHFSDICKFKQTEIITPYLSVGLGGAGIVYGNRRKGLALYVPVGFGVKWKVNKRINLGAEYSVRWYLSDNLDTDKASLLSFNLGKGNDWCNLFRVFVTFDFGKRLCDCPIYYHKMRKGY